MANLRILRLPDGLQLAFDEQGDPAGRAVLSLHGLPGSRLNPVPIPGAPRASTRSRNHLRQTGYGGSDASPGRRVVDVVSDLAALLDHLGVERLGVVGGSGGGSHALALATLLADRCTVVHGLVGVAPAALADQLPYLGHGNCQLGQAGTHQEQANAETLGRADQAGPWYVRSARARAPSPSLRAWHPCRRWRLQLPPQKEILVVVMMRPPAPDGCKATSHRLIQAGKRRGLGFARKMVHPRAVSWQAVTPFDVTRGASVLALPPSQPVCCRSRMQAAC